MQCSPKSARITASALSLPVVKAIVNLEALVLLEALTVLPARLT